MQMPSLTLIISTAFIGYILYSIWTLSMVFQAPKCTQKPCFTSFLATNPELQLVLFTSAQANPISSEVTKVATFNSFRVAESYSKDLEIEVPLKTRRNGTLFMHAVLTLDNGVVDWKQLKRDGPTVIQKIGLTEYAVPKASTFNLLGQTETETKKPKEPIKVKTVSHLRPKIFLVILTDPIQMSSVDIPPELARLVRVSHKNEFLPIIQNDFLKSRLNDLQEINRNSTKMTVEFNYAPTGIGKLRLLLHVEHAVRSLEQLGFSKKDVDEVKGIFSDTNVYLLCGTVFVGSIHVLFDFLSFKNDVSFWRRKRTFEGLSLRTTLWRAFSQIIVFLYLFDENTSLLVLIPTGIATLIELWKCKKILKVEVTRSGLRVRTGDASKNAEQLTEAVDREAMRYLSYVLYPLCAAGAVYSLIYQPHKSWYSWTLNSMVNGVYAFGFLFMLPQLFINYKLKSVAALPWRAFMYKSFNTFIDDIFAFIITMPTSHRVACFRDDIVFLIYLYQRWLYPVDKSRIDDGVNIPISEDHGKEPDSKEKANEASDKKRD